MKTLKVHTMDEWSMVAETIIETAASTHDADTAVVVTLEGDLGAGKTTLVQAMAQKLGVEETVTSPTFTLMRRYELPDKAPFEQLVHIDAYRIEDPEEMRVLRLPEVLATKGVLVCIEWPSRIATLLPHSLIAVTIEASVSDDTRTITIHA